MSRLRDSYLGQGWLILLLAGVFGALLAAVHLKLSPRIEDNIRAEIMREIPGLLLGAEVLEGASITIEGDLVTVEPAAGEPRVLTIVEQPSEASALYQVAEGDPGRLLGWVARGQDHGYADVIELLVGLTGDTTQITGIYVLNQKETPALGDGIVRSDFRQHFAGIATDSPLTVGRNAEEAAQSPYAIQALTGATVSSRSVCNIVNDTVALVKVEIAEEPEGFDARP